MTGTFHPIAIVGRGCVLPGCLSPEDLWRLVAAGADQVTPPPAGDWRADMARVLGARDTSGRDRAVTDRGGYVGALDEALDLAAHALDAAFVDGLDPVVRWSLHAAGQALAGVAREAAIREGLILGNLSYPTRSHARLAEQHWLEAAGAARPERPVAPINRFMSGAPAMLVAQAYGLAGGSLALDAACASGLYAIKVACDRLQDGEADLMLAGAVNAVDQLFLHTGFTALNALSKSGRSRPFHCEADGLIPAEGAAFVALKRVEDALAAGDRILGVIRGVGLSNDGRSGGFLSPSQDGQTRAMAAALDQAGIAAEAVQYIECHATGTLLGDAIELASLRQVYGECPPALGSLKANVGHLVTASGIAGLIKTLAAMEHAIVPATPAARPLANAVEAGGFVVPEQATAWDAVQGQRTAAVSSFGFGGNNAHLIVQQSVEPSEAPIPLPVDQEDVVIVGVGVRTHLDPDFDSFTARMLRGRRPDPAFDGDLLHVDARKLVFPPVELGRALGQQLALIKVAEEALVGLAALDPLRSGVYVGMQTDTRVCLHGVRARWPELLAEAALPVDDIELVAAGDRFAAPLDSAAVIGEMPNVTANRLSNQYDLRSPGFAVSREELSGDAALALAIAALGRRELDAALVGAVDLCRESVHETLAPDVLGAARSIAADAAVMFVLKRRSTAAAAGDPILAVLDRETVASAASLANDDPASVIARDLGHAHAASGMLQIALGVAMLRARCRLDEQGSAQPLLGGTGPLAVAVRNRSFLGEHANWRLSIGTGVPRPAEIGPALVRYGAHDRASLIAALRADRRGGEGPCRLAIVGATAELAPLRLRAVHILESAPTTPAWSFDGISFREAPLVGELAFAFTGAASAYPGMGRGLLLAVPDLVDQLAPLTADVAGLADAYYRDGDADAAMPFRQLAGSSFLCQLHSAFTLGRLKLRPTASIGLSSGETNAMFAFGVWRDIDGLLEDVSASGLYSAALANRFDAVRAHWQAPSGAPITWNNLRVRAPMRQVAAAVAEVRHVYLTIVNSPDDCVIGGDDDACRKVLAALGDPPAMPLNHDLAVHCPAVTPFEEVWRKAHSRATHQPSLPVRFYANAFGGVIEPSAEIVTEALTAQALKTIDFPMIVERAWADGVRIFVEHGPRSSLSTAIGEILGDRPHLAVSLDRVGVEGDLQAWRAAATLWCAGVELDLSTLDGSEVAPVAESAVGPMVRLVLRPEPPTIARKPTGGARRMPRPPILAPARRSGSADVEKAMPPRSPAAADRHVPAKLAVSGPGDRVLPDIGATIASDAVAPLANRRDQLVLAHRRLTEGHQLYLAAQQAAMTAFVETSRRLLAGLLSPTGALPPVSSATIVRSPVDDVATAPLEAAAPPARLENAVVASPSAAKPPAAVRPGPKFDRQQLETLAGGQISAVFGESFAAQDGFAIQVRMPQPPLLLCDRVLGIEGAAHSMGRGTIWTETDVLADSWYLHHGRMPPGIFIECGQADLLLISWLGIDAHNRGERAYRLLGCELTFYGELPKPGDVLSYEIKIDGHARQGDVRLFFFHYDCRIDGDVRISVRNGQAGFFTRKELDHSGGVIWDATAATYRDGAPVVRPVGATERTSFSAEDVSAYLDGRLAACFGETFALADTQTRPPASPSDHRNFLGHVPLLDFAGGPAGRGYLRVETKVTGDEWFFDGHFHGDPCMPGTLMADACLQAMAFYMAASGLTLSRDGWRYQPVAETLYKFLCRGQVTPRSRNIVYEIFVDEFVAGDVPTLFAHVLCSVDGRKAFLCERLGLQLVPDWPLSSMAELVDRRADQRPLARIGDFPLDHASLIACALGKPSNAFGRGLALYDAGKRSPRLPGPPYHFMTRIIALEGEMAVMKPGAKVTALYDIPPDAWYFADNPGATMPNCVLMELALQPCGWLATYTLRQDRGVRDLLFRNLDGEGIQHREITPADGTIATAVELLSVDAVGELIIEKFSIRCTIGTEEIFRCETVFGFFPPEAMRDQKGFAASPQDLARLAAASDVQLELADRPPALCGPGAACLPTGKLRMIDRISGFWPDGGNERLGAIRAEKDVRPSDWFFKAHFYQDPVQPGSLGVEAILQAMQALMLLDGSIDGFARPRFEPLAIGEQILWHYRGQVTPERARVTVEFEVTERIRDALGVAVIGFARLWADGLQIYQLPRIGLRIVEDRSDRTGPRSIPWSLDLAGKDFWLADHCPTYTLPVVPLACELEMMLQAAAAAFPHRRPIEIARADARTWIALREAQLHGTTLVEPIGQDQLRLTLKEGDVVSATAEARLGDAYPAPDLAPLEPLLDPRPITDSYADAAVFHGPAFQLMTGLVRGSNGATVTLDGGRGAVPRGILHPALIDAALHGISDNPEEWAGSAQAGRAVYPLWIERLQLFGDLAAAGEITAELRFRGVEDGSFFRVHVRLIAGSTPLATFDLVEILLPKGRIGVRSGRDRRAFFKERRFVRGMALAEVEPHRSCLSRQEARQSNWLAGTQEQIYAASTDEDLVVRIVTGDHVGQRLGLHPSEVFLVDGQCANLPLNRWPLAVDAGAGEVCVTSGDPEPVDWRSLDHYWLTQAAGRRSFVHDLGLALIHRFVRRVVVADPQGFSALAGRPVLYLANHQTAVESFLFMTVVAALGRLPMAAIAKREHADSWIGIINRLSQDAMGGRTPLKLLLFDRERQSDLLRLLDDFGKGLASEPTSLLVHTDGTRARCGGAPVRSVSSVLIDLALNHDLPIVPVRFAGGLPAEPSAERQEFPVDHGRQDYFLGRAIPPGVLKAMPFAERAAFVLAELNGLGPVNEADVPLAGDPAFAQAVEAEAARGLSNVQAVLRAAIEAFPGIGEQGKAALDGHPAANAAAIIDLIGSAPVPAE